MKLITHSLKLLLLVVSAVMTKTADAQQFTWQTHVAKPQQEGFNRILLSPQVTGRLQADFSDIRLYNNAGQEVPYLLRTEQPVQYKRLFKEYDILSYTHQKGCCSELLISNPDKHKLNNISLLISNADVRKDVKLSGSDNRQDWYVLKDKHTLYAINNNQSTAEVKLLDFPLSDYRYFRLQLNDSASAPLNILQAGYYDTYTEAGKYTSIPVQNNTRKDSASVKSTYITLRFAQPVYPDRLEFSIVSPQLYHRNGYVLLGKEQVMRRRRSKRKRQQNQQRSVPFVLSSNAPAIVELPRLAIEELTIVIQNADNRPLEFDEIKPLQLNRYLVADLSRDQDYTLKFGNSKAEAPEYELQYFQDSIPADLPILQTAELKQIRKAEKQKDNTTTIIIWAAIAVVIAGLTYMTIRLLKEMDTKKQV
ncbi:hypothetical protein [Pontibacter populi]|uniref:DUF3999 domain-containing protein n=1 Tax=Pontibacter populi TaxID=890055 RepID=A0ABV1RXX9_9BACT